MCSETIDAFLVSPHEGAERFCVALPSCVDELAIRLARAAEDNPNTVVLIRGDQKVPYGRIAQVMVSPGRRVRTGDALIALYDTDAMIVRAQLPAHANAELVDAIREQVDALLEQDPTLARLLKSP